MNVRYLGHSSFQISTMGRTLIVDPFILSNKLARKIDVNALKADYILITHGHGDHMEDARSIAARNHAPVISNFEIIQWFKGKHVDGFGMNIGGKHDFDFGTLKCVSATHSSTLPDNDPGGNPLGFVIMNEEAVLYIAGDTGLSMDMRLIPMMCPRLSAAILPIGDYYTMGYEDALIAAGFIQCDRVIGCHYDTFDDIRIDHEKAIGAFAAEDRELILLEIGSEISI